MPKIVRICLVMDNKWENTKGTCQEYTFMLYIKPQFDVKNITNILKGVKSF